MIVSQIIEISIWWLNSILIIFYFQPFNLEGLSWVHFNRAYLSFVNTNISWEWSILPVGRTLSSWTWNLLGTFAKYQFFPWRIETLVILMTHSPFISKLLFSVNLIFKGQLWKFRFIHDHMISILSLFFEKYASWSYKLGNLEFYCPENCPRSHCPILLCYELNLNSSIETKRIIRKGGNYPEITNTSLMCNPYTYLTWYNVGKPRKPKNPHLQERHE